MENNGMEKSGGSARKKTLFGFGVLMLSALAFFGFKRFNKSKKQTNETKNDPADPVDSEIPVQTPPIRVPRAALPPAGALASFPLHVGSKGANVRILQECLVRKYGAAVLPKYGADGFFGNELAAAIRKLGYALPLKETDYKMLTQGAARKTLKIDPASIAFSLHVSLMAKDYNSAITLLKGIGNTANYALVSDRFKNYFINGVRQSVVTAMLRTFNEKSQKENTKKVLADIGLKYNKATDKWSLNGILHGQIESKEDTVVWNESGVQTPVKAGQILGWVVKTIDGTVRFLTANNQSLFAKGDAVRLVKEPVSGLAGQAFEQGQWVQTVKPTLIVTDANTEFIAPAGIPLGRFLNAKDGWAFISANPYDSAMYRARITHLTKN